jgi:outer membrane receptor protein involved in Fe transport
MIAIDGFMHFRPEASPRFLPLHAVAAACGVLLAHMGAQAQTSTPAQGTLQAVTVISTMPLPGLEQMPEEVPAAVQTATAQDMAGAQSVDLSDFMRQRMGSVHVNENQGNPMQADLSYRGYTASPLLGTPQGLSVYMDGMRMNQPFGDVVSWDLIPLSAIRSVTLMPGSNPVFGLNTLGGAVVLQTKDGRSDPGSVLESGAGSSGRRQLQLTHGARLANDAHLFATANFWSEDGWRQDSKSRLGQFFGKWGGRESRTDWSLSVAAANNRLMGNGLQEARLLQGDYRSVYTKPDITENRSLMLNLGLTHRAGEHALWSGNVYWRKIRTSTFNGDVNEDALDQSVYQPNTDERDALAAAGYWGYPVSGANAANTPFPMWRCIANVLLNDEPAEKCNGLITTTASRQSQHGFNLQSTHLSEGGHAAGAWRNQWVWGLGHDMQRTSFRQGTQLGYLNPDRSITGLNAHGDGVTGGTVDGQAYDTRVDLQGRTHTWSVYTSNTLSLAERWHITAAARYNQTRVRNHDQILPGGGPGSLDGDHRFSRLNPALGLSWVASPQLNAYAGYSQASRTPTAIELGCADPNNPCKLPNAMAGDPPLKQVLTQSWEAGVRGKWGAAGRWSAGMFHADNRDDILFVSNSATGYGYFRNFGKTLRKGIEMSLESTGTAWSWGAHLTLQSATFRSPETLNGASNSSNDAASPGLEGNIAVQPGHHIPQIPSRIFKAWLGYRHDARWSGSLTLNAIGGSYARGNENNQHQADGVYHLGGGRNPGYATLDLATRYAATQRTSVLMNVKNLFNRRYTTSAQLGANAFTADGRFVARPFAAVAGEYPLVHSTFYAPGAPRSVWLGLRIEM